GWRILRETVRGSHQQDGNDKKQRQYPTRAAAAKTVRLQGKRSLPGFLMEQTGGVTTRSFQGYTSSDLNETKQNKKGPTWTCRSANASVRGDEYGLRCWDELRKAS